MSKIWKLANFTNLLKLLWLYNRPVRTLPTPLVHFGLYLELIELGYTVVGKVQLARSYRIQKNCFRFSAGGVCLSRLNRCWVGCKQTQRDWGNIGFAIVA